MDSSNAPPAASDSKNEPKSLRVVISVCSGSCCKDFFEEVVNFGGADTEHPKVHLVRNLGVLVVRKFQIDERPRVKLSDDREMSRCGIGGELVVGVVF